MPKFFVKNEQIKENQIEILGEDVNHIVNVLRLQKHDKIVVANLESAVSYKAEILELHKEKVICQIIEKIEETTESNVNVTIFQGLPKADKMEYIIQKTTELGVKKLIPVSMKRCIVKLDEKDKTKKIARWQKIAEVASKQSQRDMIPEIGNIENLKQVCEKIKDFEIFLVAYENEENVTLKRELLELKKRKVKEQIENINIAILIGPEGGLEEEEVHNLKELGAKVVSLGKRILRTETAPLAMLSNIMYELEE